MEPIIKKNQIKKAYYHWLSESAERKLPKKVITVEFIGFYYKQERFLKGMPKPFYAPNGEAYVAEVWKCKDLISGKEMECKFRHPVPNDNETKNSSLQGTEYPVFNAKEPNLLIDSLDEYYQNIVNKKYYPNKLLRRHNQKHLLRVQKIKDLLKEDELTIAQKTGLFLMLRHKETPTAKTFNSLQKLRKENPDVYDQLIAKINYESISSDTLPNDDECRPTDDFRNNFYSEMGDS